jgi:hypothetical protein
MVGEPALKVDAIEKLRRIRADIDWLADHSLGAFHVAVREASLDEAG